MESRVRRHSPQMFLELHSKEAFSWKTGDINADLFENVEKINKNTLVLPFKAKKIFTVTAKLKALAYALSEVDAWARLHVKGVNNLFWKQFGI